MRLWLLALGLLMLVGQAAQAECPAPLSVPSHAWLLISKDDIVPARERGSVCWSAGQDSEGTPTIIANVSLPGGDFSLDAELTLRKGTDPTLPAAMLLELEFTFIGPASDKVISVPGLLTKDQVLVAGQPLIGASARVIDNVFIFAFTNSEPDASDNTARLRQPYFDVAMVLGSDARAVMTLAMEGHGAKLVRDTLKTWAK